MTLPFTLKIQSLRLFSVSLTREDSHLSQVFHTCCFFFLDTLPFHLTYSYSAFESWLKYYFLIATFPYSDLLIRLAS